jgi:hypothetical protein
MVGTRALARLGPISGVSIFELTHTSRLPVGWAPFRRVPAGSRHWTIAARLECPHSMRRFTGTNFMPATRLYAAKAPNVMINPILNRAFVNKLRA